MEEVSTGEMLRAFRGRVALALVGVALAGGLASLIHAEFVFPVVLAGLTASLVQLIRELRPILREAADLESDTEALRERLCDVDGAICASSEGIARVDDEGRFVWVNAAYGAMLGYEPEELKGMSAKTGVHPEDLEKMSKAFGVLRDSGLASVLQVRIITKSDHTFFTRVELVRSFDPEAQPGFFAFIQDLTEEKEIGAALDLKSTELARLNTELEQFAYVAAHDLQEPARKVISFAALLEKDFEGELPENARRDLHFISDAARRMQHLVADLLTLSRAGRTAMTTEMVDLDTCLDTALDALEIKVEETGAEIIRDPLPVVNGDRTLLTQLLQNLVSNALKFCDEDRPEIQITADRTPSALVIGVRDNGIGIEPAYAKQIFQPFKRLHGRGEYEGTGIGLAICQKAVDRHRGKIWVESEFGKGSHFRFTIDEPRREQQ
ncbi:MAG: PAS domain S-box protein [Deltaproteobacteria bacterium]|nr:PAS domain S-box protein [Deltaproteobacteria bacterium]MBW2691616.1 PAS domain S-box protein [Deltaproteobacteria bacterium]